MVENEFQTSLHIATTIEITDLHVLNRVSNYIKTTTIEIIISIVVENEFQTSLHIATTIEIIENAFQT